MKDGLRVGCKQRQFAHRLAQQFHFCDILYNKNLIVATLQEWDGEGTFPFHFIVSYFVWVLY